MFSTSRLLTATLVLASAAVWCGAVPTTAQEKKVKGDAVGNAPVRWEYKTVPLAWRTPPDEVDKTFNALGLDGWELTTSTFVDKAATGATVNHVFKRAKR